MIRAVTVIVAFAILGAVPVENVRVLAVETRGGKSHWNFMSGLLRSLTDAGHEVVAFTPFPDGPRANYTEIDTSGQVKVHVGVTAERVLKDFALMSTNVAIIRHNCDGILRHRRFEGILRDHDAGTAKFDVVIADPSAADCVSHVAHTLNLPVVYSISSSMLTFAERRFTGHASNPACISNLIAHHSVPRTFVQRLTNTFTTVYSTAAYEYENWLQRITDPKPYDSSPSVPPSVIFQNSYYGTEAPRPVPTNLIDVGGIHLKPAGKIPKDILEFIEESSHGVIYFTFGSVFKISSLPHHIIKAFKEALANVPQRVLWKYEDEMEDLPENVMIKKWFPQRDILLHPKIKLFISHGGISGVYEALDAGVPVLGFPLFYDQLRNIDNLVSAEMAISMDLFSVSKKSLLNAFLELITDEKYTKNAKIASIRFKDRPMSPQQSVIYWTEYVIRHNGAPHLRSLIYNSTWYQYFLLDVVFVLLIPFFLISYLIYKIISL